MPVPLLAQVDSNFSQENAAPNLFAVAGLAPQPGQAKRTQKKAAQRGSSKKMAAAAAAAVVAEMVAEEDAARGERSPRPGKQQKVGGGAIALAHRALAIEVADHNSTEQVAGGSWQSVEQVSPPLIKAQERHMAFAQRAQAFATRGSSKLAVSGREARVFDGLAVGVEGCAI